MALNITSIFAQPSSTPTIFSAMQPTVSQSLPTIFTALQSPTVAQPQSIQQILNTQSYNTKKNNFITNIANDIKYVANGQKQPKQNWEKVVAYSAQTGKPLSITLDNKNNVIANYQSANNPMENLALQDVDNIAQKIQANDKNITMLNNLSNAEYKLQDIAKYVATPTEQWQRDGVNLIQANKPMKISLDSKGNLQVQDQLTDPMNNLSPQDQKSLRAAVASIPNIIGKGTYTKSWQVDASNFAANKLPYYLDIDPITHQISAKENNATNIVPSFLNTPPYPDLGTNKQWEKDAAKMIQNKTPFYLDFSKGTPKPMELNAKNLISQLNPPTTPTANILSILA